MTLAGRGLIQGGHIVLTEPLALPEGTEVVVHVEPVTPVARTRAKDFASLPFFGMWADRDDIPDSSTLVRKEREQWHRRATRQD